MPGSSERRTPWRTPRRAARRPAPPRGPGGLHIWQGRKEDAHASIRAPASDGSGPFRDTYRIKRQQLGAKVSPQSLDSPLSVRAAQRSVFNDRSGLGSDTGSSKPARNSPSLSGETVALTSLRTRSDTPLTSTCHVAAPQPTSSPTTHHAPTPEPVVGSPAAEMPDARSCDSPRDVRPSRRHCRPCPWPAEPRGT